jgi:hypothetical protein
MILSAKAFLFEALIDQCCPFWCSVCVVRRLRSEVVSFRMQSLIDGVREAEQGDKDIDRSKGLPTMFQSTVNLERIAWIGY